MSQDEALKLQIEPTAVDALVVAAGTKSNDLEILRTAAGQCKGELLSNIVVHAESFEEWLSLERSNFGLTRLRLFEKLADMESGYARVEIAQQLVALDPMRESSQRVLMKAYADVGENALALKQYERCRELLRSEMNIEPATETRDLRERIVEVT